MVPTLKAEFKKLITVRSTYFLVLAILILVGLVNYLNTSKLVYEEEVAAPKNASQQTTEERTPEPETRVIRVSNDLSKEKLFTNMQDSVPVVAIFIGVAVVLLMAHEFRYNTIAYTLTASRSRSKVLLSKIIVSIAFTVAVTLMAISVITAVTYLAVHIKGLNLPAQTFNWGYIISRLVGYTLGFSLLGLAIITLVRNLTAGIAALLILPSIDGIVSAILNSRNIESSKFLPYSALNRINNIQADLYQANVPDDGVADLRMLPATLLGATAVFAAYFIGLWIISWYLFLRRDAI